MAASVAWIYSGATAVMFLQDKVLGAGMSPGLAQAMADAVDNLTSAGTNQAAAYEIRNAINRFSTVASGTGARLPQRVQPGDEVLIYNNGANDLLVYPDVGAAIDSNSTNASVTVPAGTQARFTRHKTTLWSMQSESATDLIFVQSGTGAVATDLQTKNRQIVSVFDFMTGPQIVDALARTKTLDLTTPLQNAINAVYDNSLGGLYWPSANYKTTKSLMVWGGTDLYTSPGMSLFGQDKTNTIITKTTNSGFGGVSAYANDDAIFVLARRDLTAGNAVPLKSIHIENFNLQGTGGLSQVAYGIYNRCSTGASSFRNIVCTSAIGFQSLTDFFKNEVRNCEFIVATKGFSMLASGTSNHLSDVFVSGASSIGYELGGDYSSGNSLACDNCTGIPYQFTGAVWTINGMGSESPSATTIVKIAAGSASYVVLNGPHLFPQNNAADVVFDVGSGSTLIVNGGTVGDGSSPLARAGKFAAINSTAKFKMNDLVIQDTYSTASTGPFATSAGETKFGVVSVPTATATTLYTLNTGEEVGMFYAYLSGNGVTDNASIFAIAYVGIAGGNSGFAVLASGSLTLTNVAGVIKVQHALGVTYNVGWKFVRAGDYTPVAL